MCIYLIYIMYNTYHVIYYIIQTALPALPAPAHKAYVPQTAIVYVYRARHVRLASMYMSCVLLIRTHCACVSIYIYHIHV